LTWLSSKHTPASTAPNKRLGTIVKFRSIPEILVRPSRPPFLPMSP
jgi:hypothetical protein